MALQPYLCTLTNPERGTDPSERETTIVLATDKTDAAYRAMRRIKRAIGAELARSYSIWSVKLIPTTF